MTFPTYFISHGGGPWPFMSGPTRSAHGRLEAALREMPQQLRSMPKAVLMVSAHWVEAEFTVMANAQPGMLYDYSDFPAETYRVEYRAPGSPVLAHEVQALAQSAGLTCHSNAQRGFDHGVFAPLAVIYPDADLPVVQLSLKRGYDPQQHLALGRALAPLRQQGVLIIGSGLSFHNMGLRGPVAAASSRAFDDWLRETLNAAPVEREARLAHWADAPSGRLAHPTEEHLLPLMVALGAACEEPVQRVYHEQTFFGSAVISSYRFGAAT